MKSLNMSWRFGIWFGVCAAICAPSGQQTHAAEVERVSARASSQLIGGFNRRALFAVDGMGLTGGAHGIVPDGAMWLSNGTFADPNDTDPEITFDLGGVNTIDSMTVWNYNEFVAPGGPDLTTRGVATADVLVAGEDRVFSLHMAGQALDRAPGTETDFSQSINLGSVTARYVKLDITGTHGADNGFAGLSEVKFDGAVVAGQNLPVPATIHEVSSNLAGFDRVAEYVVNRHGLLGDTHDIAPDHTMWLNQGSFANVPPEEFDTDPFITFDLGEVKSLAALKVWNYNEFLPGRDDLLNRGIQFADVMVAGEDLVFSTLISAQELAIAPGNEDDDFGQLISLGGAEARYVKLANLVNYGNAENFVGLSEVQILVPEPASLSLFAAAVLLLTARRRRR